MPRTVCEGVLGRMDTDPIIISRTVQAAEHKEEHMCAAELHACGAPCHMGSVNRDGKALCSLPCIMDW
jgi:hypothetical protein